MNEADRLRKLFAYDGWACQKVLDVLHTETSFALRDEAVNMFAHILASQEQWYSRIADNPVKNIELWPVGNLSEFGEHLRQLSKKWRSLINANEQQLDRFIEYQTSKGDAYRTMLSDILHHVIIHGQHHRAQIASMLRRTDLTPPPTDYIFYLRQEKT